MSQSSTQPSRASAHYALGILTAISAAQALDRTVLSVLLEPIKQELKLSDSEMGLVIGLGFAIFYAGFGLPLARIADRRSRIALLSVCLTLWSGMTGIAGFARDFTHLFLARIGVGIGEAGCSPAAQSLIGDLYPADRRAFAVSVYQAGNILGGSAGLAITAAIAAQWGWRVALVATGAIGIPLALLAYLTVREPIRGAMGATPPPAATEDTRAVIAALLRRRPLLHLILGLAIAVFGAYGLAQWMPAFYVRLHHLSIGQVGLYVGGIGAIAGVAGTLFGGSALTRLAPRDHRWELWWPASVFVGSIPFWLIAFSADDWRVALGAQLVAGFISGSGGGVALSAMQSYTEPHRRATAAALLLILSSILGMGIGPVLVGAVSDLLAARFGTASLRYALMGSTGLFAWASLHFWLAAHAAPAERADF
jgi:predicted MFS family arabinose efflux permease